MCQGDGGFVEKIAAIFQVLRMVLAGMCQADGQCVPENSGSGAGQCVLESGGSGARQYVPKDNGSGAGRCVPEGIGSGAGRCVDGRK